MKISPLTEKDIDTIIAISDGFLDGWNKEMFLSGLKNDLCIYGLYDDDLKGYIAYDLFPDYADIEIVLIKSSDRKKGYGGALIKFALEKIKETGREKVFLEVRESNAPAISLYTKFGFNKINERKKYYPDGENALVFLRS